MRKYLALLIMLFCLLLTAWGQTITDLDISRILTPSVQVKNLRYWFDRDTGNIQTADGLSGTYVVNVDNLADGLHTLHCQVTGNDGLLYGFSSAVFLKMTNSIADLTPSIVVDSSELHYWFDSDTDHTQVVSGLSGNFILDVSSLEDGLHTIHYQVVGVDGTGYDSASSMFLKMTSNTGDSSIGGSIYASELKYWYDEDADNMQTASDLSGTYILDTSALNDGLHVIHYQLIGTDGNTYGISSSVFLKMVNSISGTSISETLVAQKVKYWFNKDVVSAAQTEITKGVQAIDVSGLASGLHTIHYQLVYNDGNVGPTATGFFFKDYQWSKNNGNAITRYQYWMNDHVEFLETVNVKNATNPYLMIGLVPMQTDPIRSSLFHLEVSNGVPIVYAKNSFNIRFYDSRGYFKDFSKPFIDYSVSETVIPVGELQPTQTFDKVADNSIRWYTITNVEAGDSLTFKSSQATTIQLFSPSGKELYSASGPESVTLGGRNTWENGTHYLAVHDVTGSKATMTLNYERIDKYAVLSQDVTCVGNGGCSTITFKGNGFRDLYAVELYNEQGDTIKQIDIGHESNAFTTVTFNFTDAILGQYDVLFHFTTEDRYYSGYVTVEESKDIQLTKTVTFPSAFPHGLSTTYTVKITNNGNMTAYSVPIYTWIMNKGKKDGIYHIKYDGLDLSGIFDGVDMDSLSVSERAELQVLSDEIGDSHYFMLFRVEDEDSPGDSVWVRSNYFFTNLAPYETKTLKLTLSANEGVWAYFTVPEDWPSHNVSERESTSHMVKHRSKPQNTDNWYCCYRDRVECVANITMLVLDAASMVKPELGIADCALGWANQKLQAAGDTYCGTNDVEGDFAKSVNALTKAASAASVLAGCAGHSGISNVINALLHPSVAIECVTAFFQKIPDCPPCETCNDGGGSGGGSWDPNDIFGYLSKSGCLFISDQIPQVNYTIEFENDTTFAEAAAHSVVIKDTLDSRYFDLKSFVPTTIRIGSHNVLLEDKDITNKNDVTSFIKTIDMRPSIYAIAQAEGTFNQKTGIAEWRFTTLDPMTMEPAEDVMQGILPVNYDGASGIGEVMFEIGVKPNKGDGTEVRNRAGIVFDANEAIMTPTWTNIVDAIAPTSTILGGIQKDDETLTLRLAGEDNRSGVWRYNVYAQAGKGASWELVAENVTDSLCNVHIYDGIEYGFLVLATDSAGNVERKGFEEADFGLSTVKLGDANGDGTVDALDVVLATSYYLGNDVFLNFAAADVVADGEINSLDVVAIQNIYLNTSSSVKARIPRRRHRKLKP